MKSAFSAFLSTCLVVSIATAQGPAADPRPIAPTQGGGPSASALDQNASSAPPDSNVTEPAKVDDNATAPVPVDDDVNATAPADHNATAMPADEPFDPFAAPDAPSDANATSVEVVAPTEDVFEVKQLDVVGVLDEDARKAPGSVQVLDEKALEKFNYDDAHQVLQQVPGVYVRQEDGFGLRPNIGMRGADPDRSKKITLMEDGILFGPAPYSAPAAYYFPIMTRMTGVEISKGASSIRFGPQTIGGGLDLRTRETPDKGQVAGIDASAGNTYYTKLHGYGGYGNERAGLLAEAVHLSSTGFKELDGGGDTGFSKQELMIKGRINSDPNASVYQRGELKLGYSREDSRETYLGLTDEDFRDNPLRRYAASRLDQMDNWRTQGEISHLLGLGEHFELKTAIYRHDFRRTWDRLDHLVDETGRARDEGLKQITDDPGSYPMLIDLLRGETTSANAGNARLLIAGNRRHYVSQGVQAIARGDFQTSSLSHVIEVGLRAHQDEIARRHTATSYELLVDGDDPFGETDFSAPNKSLPLLANNKVSTFAFAAHAVYDVTYERLTLSPGVRAEIIRATYEEKLGAGAGDETKFDPNVILFALGARYALSEELSVIAGAQQGMTPVSPGPGSASTSLEVERAVNYEAGVRYAGALGAVQAFGFLSDYDNVVTPCDENCGSGTGSGVSFSSGTALIYGVELGGSTRVTMPRGYGLPLRGSYTYTHATFTEAFDTGYEPYGGTGENSPGEVKSGDFLPYVPPHQFMLGAGVDWQMKVGADLALNFMDRMREEAGQGALETGKYTDRYAMLDLAAYYSIFEHTRIYLKGDNLTNNQPIVSRRPFGARPNKPLIVQVGLRWEL